MDKNDKGQVDPLVIKWAKIPSPKIDYGTLLKKVEREIKDVFRVPNEFL